MGKSVPRGIKSRAEYLTSNYPEQFSENFTKNKETLSKLELPFSKVTRNILAGFIGRLVKAKSKE